MTHTRLSPRASFLVVASLVTLAACTTADDDADPDPTSTSPPTTAATDVAEPSDDTSPPTPRPDLRREVTDDELLDHLATFPSMPLGTAGLLAAGAVSPAEVTFGSGTPFNDLHYTLFDTDYIEGETSGYDTFMPVDPGDEFPGAGEIRVVHAVSNPQVDEAYEGARGDRIILGLADGRGPFFRSPGDGIDDDYVVIVDLDLDRGHVQLAGSADDYRLIYANADEVASEGWYLLHLGTGSDVDIDLIAYIAPCGEDADECVVEPGALSLDDPVQFRFAEPLPDDPAVPNGIAQDGTAGAEIVTGVTVDDESNLYLFGSGDGNLDGGDDAENELFVAKYTADGEQVWVTELAVANGGLLFDAVADEQYLYAVGRTFGALPGATSGGVWDGIILKLDLATGDIVATDQWGNDGIDGYGAVALDDAGNLYVSGAGSPPGAPVDPEGTGAGDPFFVLAKHDTTTLSNVWRQLDPVLPGSQRVAEAWGGVTYVPGDASGAGQVMTGGWFRNQPGGADGFLALYDDVDTDSPRRVATHVVQSPGLRADWVFDHGVDADGNLYAIGATTGALDGEALGDGDAFIVRFGPGLTDPTYRQIGTEHGDIFRELEVAPDGTVYAVGYTMGDLATDNPDADRLTADVIVAAFDAELEVLETYQFGTPGEDRGAIALDGDRLVIGGMTEGAMVAASAGTFDLYALALDDLDAPAAIDAADLDGADGAEVRTTSVGPVASTPVEAFDDVDFLPARSVVIEPGGVVMAYVEAGPSDGPVALLLHGNPAWSYYYHDVIDELAEIGYRVIAPDLIGFGRSDKPLDRAAHTYANHVAWVGDFVEQLDLDDIVLHAHDWGGLIGMRVVPEQPARFAGVSIVNSGLPDGDPSPLSFERWQRAAQTIEQFSVVLDRGTTRALTAAELDAYDAPWPSDELMFGPRELALQVPFGDMAEAANNAAVLEQFWADWDRPFTITFATGSSAGAPGIDPDAYAELIPGAVADQPVLVDGVGHYLHLDVPGTIVDQIVAAS